MRKILIIDDDKTVTFALVMKFKSLGYECTAAYDAMMGVNLAIQFKPDLVILDIMMPAGGGFSVAERMQNLVATIGTPIIFITAFKDPTLKTKAESLGAAAFYEKPYNMDHLVHTVKRLMGETTGPEPLLESP